MPLIDGIEVVQAVGAGPATGDIPVILFTANSDKLTQRLPECEDVYSRK